MECWTKVARGAAVGLLSAMLPDAAFAQTAPAVTIAPEPKQAPAATPTPLSSPPTRLQGLDDFSLPSSRAGPAPVTTPAAPVLRPKPSPFSTPSPAVRSRPVPARTSVALARPSATPTPPVPAVRPTSVIAPAPFGPGPSAAPRPVPVARTPAPASPETDRPGWWWFALLLPLAIAVFMWRRRARRPDARPAVTIAPAAAIPPAPLPAPPLPPAVLRARLAIELLPRRGGLTLISLVFEGELLVRNTGDALAAQVAVEASLIPARSGQDEELGALFARPIARPATPPFALAPGEERRVRLVAALPLGGVEPLMAGGRAMIVPVLAANVVYASGAGERDDSAQTAASWIVGVARPGSEKLAPFWVDAPGLSDALGARAHSLRVER